MEKFFKSFKIDQHVFKSFVVHLNHWTKNKTSFLDCYPSTPSILQQTHTKDLIISLLRLPHVITNQNKVYKQIKSKVESIVDIFHKYDNGVSTSGSYMVTYVQSHNINMSEDRNHSVKWIDCKVNQIFIDGFNTYEIKITMAEYLLIDILNVN